MEVVQLANMVHNYITIKGPYSVITALAKRVMNAHDQMDQISGARRDTLCRCAVDGFDNTHTQHIINHGVLRDMVMSTKHYDEYCEVIKPEEVKYDLDTMMSTPVLKKHDPEIAEFMESEMNKMYELDFSFDTKWDNQNSLFSIGLLEICLDIDPVLGSLCYSKGFGSEELMHFENETLVVNRLNVNDENGVITGPHVLYKAQTHRNQLARMDEPYLPNDQVFQYLVDSKNPMTEPEEVAHNITEFICRIASSQLPGIQYSLFEMQDGHTLITFRIASHIGLTVGLFFEAITNFNYPVWSNEHATKLGYEHLPNFQLTGQFIGNTVTGFYIEELPTFEYGEVQAEWTEYRKPEPTPMPNEDMPF